jgi:hypothetical protein
MDHLAGALKKSGNKDLLIFFQPNRRSDAILDTQAERTYENGPHQTRPTFIATPCADLEAQELEEIVKIGQASENAKALVARTPRSAPLSMCVIRLLSTLGN